MSPTTTFRRTTHDRSSRASSSSSSSNRISCVFVGCAITFTRNSDRKRHERDVHQLSQLLHCPFQGCIYTSFRQDKIRDHTKIQRHQSYPGGRIGKRGDGSKQKGYRTTGMILSNMLYFWANNYSTLIIARENIPKDCEETTQYNSNQWTRIPPSALSWQQNSKR